MTTPRISRSGIRLDPRRQAGAILVVSLILLLIMTLIGVFAMRGTIMEERMAGNMRDRSLAFQAAEGGLRDGEGWLDAQTDGYMDPLFWHDPSNRPGFAYHYEDNPRLPRRASDMDTNQWNSRDANANLSGLAGTPQYWVEQLEKTPECPVPAVPCPEPLPEDDQLFRVVVQALGGSDRAEVYIESQFLPTDGTN